MAMTTSLKCKLCGEPVRKGGDTKNRICLSCSDSLNREQFGVFPPDRGKNRPIMVNKIVKEKKR